MKRLKEIKWKYYIIIVLIALLLSAPLCTNGFIESHDGVFHIARNYGTNKAILSGQMPPSIVQNFCKGFGYSWNIFYPPLGTYISGVFSLFFSILTSLKLSIILAIIVSGISMFKLMQKVTKNDDISLIVAILYMSSTYFLSNIYLRMAMGEVISYMFFPILFYGLYDIFYDGGKKNYWLTIRGVRNSTIS